LDEVRGLVIVEGLGHGDFVGRLRGVFIGPF